MDASAWAQSMEPWRRRQAPIAGAVRMLTGPTHDQGGVVAAETVLPARSRWLVLTTVGIGTFMSALDGSVVNTLLPVLSHALQTSIAGIEWVTTIYLLVISGLLLSVGRAGDLFGHKRLFLRSEERRVGKEWRSRRTRDE